MIRVQQSGSPSNGAELVEQVEFLLGGFVVADVAVEDLAALLVGVSDHHRDRHIHPGADVEDVSFLALSFLAACSGVASQVEHVQAGELVRQAGPQAILGVAVDERVGGDEGHDPRSPIRSEAQRNASL